MKRPLFSVIIPTYNRPKMVVRAVESVLQQDWADWELIIVDDGSKAEVVAQYNWQDERISLIIQENTGPGGARKHGFSVAKGRYLCLLDDDDYFFYHHLSTLAETLEIEDYPERIFRTRLLSISHPFSTGVGPEPIVSSNKLEQTQYEYSTKAKERQGFLNPDYDNNKDVLLQYWQTPCGITSLCFPRSIIERAPIDPTPRIIEDFAWLSGVFVQYELQQLAGPATVAYVQHTQNRTLTESAMSHVEERVAIVQHAYLQPGVEERVPKAVYHRLLQHQFCHAARQCFLGGQRDQGWQNFWRALGYGINGWRDLLRVLACFLK